MVLPHCTTRQAQGKYQRIALGKGHYEICEPGNGNVHRAAANIIVSKNRAARGSVCNVLLSVDCPESISLEAIEVRFQLGDVIGFSISPVKFIRPAKNRILVLHNPLDKSIGAETTRSKNAK